MSEQVIRVAIAGQGRSGYGIHARWLREAPHQYKIVAVSDQYEARRNQAASEFGCRTYKDYKQLIADGDYDLFINALPSYLHPKVTIAALKAGHNVVCEKPLATKVKDFDAMVAAAQQSGKLFAPFQNSRFSPWFVKTQQIIASGVLGKIVYVRLNASGFARRWDWQTRQDLWGGNLNNTGPHAMDQAIMLFGEQMPKVFAKLGSHHELGGDADDFSLVVLHGEDAPTVEVVVSSYQAYPQGDHVNISGTRGGLAGGPSGLRWKYYNWDEAPRQEMWPGWSDDRKYCHEQLPWKEESWSPPQDTDAFQSLSKAFYDNIYEVLTRGAELVVKTEQVRRQIYAIEQAHRQNKLPKKPHPKIAVK